jgi:serine/threonine protein kinase
MNEAESPYGRRPQPPRPSPAVFVSYSSDDQNIADAICAALENEGIRCWMAPRDVQGGRPYSGQITQAIRETRVLLLVLSQASNRSKQVLREVERAAHCQNHLLTFRIEAIAPGDDLAYFLGADHWVDGFRPLPPTEHFSALIRHARALLQSDAVEPEEQSDAGASEAFAHFRILRRPDGSLLRLGKGSMGVTYKAIDTALNRQVALKVIAAELFRSPASKQRFLREARAAAQIHHPHVATIFHFGEEGGAYFYAMEFVDGEDLERYVARHGPLSPATALRVALQVAQALEAAQARHLIHRDIKPANVMAVVNRAGNLNVKLIDFGLAKETGAEALDAARITRTQDFVGSPAFASPEQCETKKLDVRSDIYSLGVTLWYMLSGKRPFSGSVGEVIVAQVIKPPPFEQLAQVPEPVIALLRRMLAKSPDDRFQTPEELQTAVEAAADELASDFSTVTDRLWRGFATTPSGKEDDPVMKDQAEPVLLTTPGSARFDNYLAIEVGALAADRYRLVSEEREGSGGRFFRAKDEKAIAGQPTEVGLKLLHPGIAADPELIELLENEIGVIQQATHPHLVRYWRLEQSSPGPWLVREWLHGFLLYDLLRWRQSLRAAELLALLEPLATTLDFVSSQGLGLVDVSVRKILVTRPLDSGSEEFAEFARGDTLELNRCRLLLNPLSLAPLLFRSRSGWDRQTIVPSSGVLSITQAQAGIRGSKAVRLYGRLVYELLSGHAPIRGADPQQYTPLPELDQSGNETLRRACVGTDSVYPNCETFWSAFKENLASSGRAPVPATQPPSPVSAPPALPLPPPGPPSKRHRTLIIAGAILAGALVMGLALFAAIRFGGPGPTSAVSPTPRAIVTPAPTPVVAATLGRETRLAIQHASKEQPWINSLGMKFVPVARTQVLFAIWDTRVQDFRAFVEQSGYDAGSNWKAPDYIQGPTHPVVNVSWQDANAFCDWLTKKEHAAGRLPQEKGYRLPTDEEWSWAVGLGYEAGDTPAHKSGKIDGYPWGTQWPAPSSAGNYPDNGTSWAGKGTSPVGSFAANRFGLYDMGGNVWQWCEDSFEGDHKWRVLRGGAFFVSDPSFARSSARIKAPLDERSRVTGFRCVVAPGSSR